MLLHQLDAIERFNGANQNRRGGSGALADDVEHEVRAIVEENVRMAMGEIHRANTRRGPAEVMARRVARRIRFCFDDAAADASSRKIMDHHFADEKAGEGDGIGGKFRAAKRTDRRGVAAFFHGDDCLLVLCAAGVGQDFPEVLGGNKIMVFRMLPDEQGNVAAQRHDAKMIGAGEIKRGPGKFGGEAFALQGLRNFSVV